MEHHAAKRETVWAIRYTALEPLKNSLWFHVLRGKCVSVNSSMLVYCQWSPSLEMKLLIFYCFKEDKGLQKFDGEVSSLSFSFLYEVLFFSPNLTTKFGSHIYYGVGKELVIEFFLFFFPPRFVSTSWKNLVFSFSSWMWKEQFFWVEGLVRRNIKRVGRGVDFEWIFSVVWKVQETSSFLVFVSAQFCLSHICA